MKRKINLLILTVISLLMLVSCNSCTTGSGRNLSADSSYILIHDTIYKIRMANDTINEFLMKASYEDSDSLQVILIEKKIDPIQVDSTKKLNINAEFEKLERTEKIIKEQSRTIDSLLSIRTR